LDNSILNRPQVYTMIHNYDSTANYRGITTQVLTELSQAPNPPNTTFFSPLSNSVYLVEDLALPTRSY